MYTKIIYESGGMYMENSIKNNLCKFLIGLFSLTFIVCLYLFFASNSEYTIAKGDVASKKIDAMQSNIWNLEPDVDTSNLDQITLKRNIYIGGMITSTLGIIICCIILFSKSSSVKYVTDSPNKETSNASKFQKLSELYYDKKLITKEEYESKREELLNNSSTIELKLKELNQLYDKNLISKDEYELKRKELLDKL